MPLRGEILLLQKVKRFLPARKCWSLLISLLPILANTPCIWRDLLFLPPGRPGRAISQPNTRNARLPVGEGRDEGAHTHIPTGQVGNADRRSTTILSTFPAISELHHVAELIAPAILSIFVPFP